MIKTHLHLSTCVQTSGENKHIYTGPDSLVVRASASGAAGCRFVPWPHHTKGDKNGTGSFLADACIKRVVPGRYKKAFRYLLRIFVMLQ